MPLKWGMLAPARLTNVIVAMPKKGEAKLQPDAHPCEGFWRNWSTFNPMNGLLNRVIWGCFLTTAAYASWGGQQDEMSGSLAHSVNHQQAGSDVLVRVVSMKSDSSEAMKALCAELLSDSTRPLPPSMAGELWAHLGDVWLLEGELEQAKSAYVNALQTKRSDAERRNWSIEEVQILKVLANIRLAQDDYLEAHDGYQRLLGFADSLHLPELKAHSTNNLGVLFLRLGDNDVAKDYFASARAQFTELGEPYYATVCAYNLALIAERQGQLEVAIRGFLEASNAFVGQEEWGDYMNCNSALSRCHFSLSDREQAKHYSRIALDVLDSELTSSSSPPPLYRTETLFQAASLELGLGHDSLALAYALRCHVEAEAHHLMDLVAQSSAMLSELYADRGDLESSHAYLKKHVRYFELIKRESSIQEIVQLKLTHEFENRLQQAEFRRLKDDAERNKKQAMLFGALLLAISLGLLFGLLYVRQKANATKSLLRQAQLELEHQELSTSLAYKSKELTTTMMYLLEKNQLLSSIAKELSRYKHDFSQKNQLVIQRIINELLKNSTKKVWEEFEVHFQEVHVDFYQNLHKEFPDLTINEKRLCAFLKLNLTTKEIAAITHQSTDAINMARFRLRKKLGMDTEEDLAGFLSSY